MPTSGCLTTRRRRRTHLTTATVPFRPAPTTGLGADELVAIAAALVPVAALQPGMDRPLARCWELVASSEVFEAWVIAWPPGGAIELHDHGDTAGAVAVVSGSLLETRVVPHADGAVTTVTQRIGPGRITAFAGGHIHDMQNTGTAPARSVHVYAPRLRAMTFYRIEDGRLQVDRTVHHAERRPS